MSLKTRKLKEIVFLLGTAEFQCQLQNWELTNNTDDGDKLYSYCPDGVDVEETDPDWSLSLTFYADWTLAGISDFLTLNDGENVEFTLDHHPLSLTEHVQWTGTVRIKAPNVGGEVRETEMTEVELQVVGVPVYSRPAVV